MQKQKTNRMNRGLTGLMRVVVVLWIVQYSAETAFAVEQPNVIVFIADDVSWNDYGCYGNQLARTPNIDSLAGNGLRYTNAFLTASSCSPSRASIITGRYPHNNGKAAELHLPIARDLPWFPELLRGNGYYTALVGKNHMSKEKRGANIGKLDSGDTKNAFDLIDNGQLKDNHGAHGKWVSAFENRPKDKPFFFWFAAIDAHRGWDGDREWKPEYGEKHDPLKLSVPPFLVDDLETRRDLASYYNEVTRYDYFVGKVVKALRESGELENTLILVLADNGRPFPRAKTRLHDSGMKTALIAHWPAGIEAVGGDCDQLVSAIDIAPTILSIAGIKPPDTIQGLDQSSTFADVNAKVRRYAFSEHNWHDYEAYGRSIRDASGFLLIENRRPELPWQGPADSVRSPSHQSLLKQKDREALTKAQADVFETPRARYELYNSMVDPNQLENLFGTPAMEKKQVELRSLLRRWCDETNDSFPANLSRDAFDRTTGESLKRKDYRGTTPGETRGATKTNSKGPF